MSVLCSCASCGGGGENCGGGDGGGGGRCGYIAWFKKLSYDFM